MTETLVCQYMFKPAKLHHFHTGVRMKFDAKIIYNVLPVFSPF
jgi:hypothetical protein